MGGILLVASCYFFYDRTRQLQIKLETLEQTIAATQEKIESVDKKASPQSDLATENVCKIFNGNIQDEKCFLDYAPLDDLEALKTAMGKMQLELLEIKKSVSQAPTSASPGLNKVKTDDKIVGRGTEVRHAKHGAIRCVGAEGAAQCVENDAVNKTGFLKCLKGKKILTSTTLTANKNTRLRYDCVAENQ